MAIKEQDKVFYEELANGDKVINLPITRANNVEGLGRSANTAYVVGDVVYVDNNKKVALKCTTTGTTSNTELDVSNRAVGESVKDGSVVWKVVSRDLNDKFADYLPLSGGTLNGKLFFEKDITGIHKTTNDDRMVISGGSGTSQTGGTLALYGKDNLEQSGGFDLFATDGTNIKTLAGRANGSLKWDNNSVVTSDRIFVASTMTPNRKIYLPSGGTWKGVQMLTAGNADYATSTAFLEAGGTLIQTTPADTSTYGVLAIRVD